MRIIEQRAAFETANLACAFPVFRQHLVDETAMEAEARPWSWGWWIDLGH